MSLLVKKYPPIAIASLDDQTLRFDCIDKQNCIQDIYLGDHVRLDEPYQLGSVYYVSPSSIFVKLYSRAVFPSEHSIANINPETKKIRSIKLPEEMNDAVRTIAHGRLVLAERGGGSIWIIKNDLIVIEVEIRSSIHRLIEVEDNKFAALNGCPIEENGNAYFEVFLVDVHTGEYIKKSIALPGFEVPAYNKTPQAGKKYLSRAEGVSQDLKKVYFIFGIEGEQRGYTLGMFDVERAELVKSTSDPHISHFMGYGQNQNALFSSNLDTGDGFAKATLVSKTTLESLIHFSAPEIPKKGKLMVVPFGDYFLLGTIDSVILLGSDGAILKTYSLPEEWVDKRYQLMIYRN